jgi:hypothetical protein
MRALLPALSLLAVGCSDRGACIMGADSISEGICSVNYREEPCASMGGAFARGGTSENLDHCRSRGYVEPIGSGGPMPQPEVDRRLGAGETISYRKPTAAKPEPAPAGTGR